MTSVRILTTGGTIASTKDEQGARPEKKGVEILGDASQARQYASLTVEEVAHIPSFTVDFRTMSTIVQRATAAADDGADGVVITHGTDTMEESAFYADQTFSAPVPIVFTGAQRRPDEPSPDGPANLINAVRAAAHNRLRTAGGSYVVFNDQLHNARTVSKLHTSNVDAFQSPDTGPLASIARDQITFHHEPKPSEPSFEPLVPTATVRVVPSGAGVPRDPIDEAVEAGVDGLVVEGTGLGNTTNALGDAIEEAVAAGVPVVIGSRCIGGSTMPVYGGGGGGETLRQHGVEFAGDLSVQKSRIKLALALTASDDPLCVFNSNRSR